MGGPDARGGERERRNKERESKKGGRKEKDEKERRKIQEKGRPVPPVQISVHATARN